MCHEGFHTLKCSPSSFLTWILINAFTRSRQIDMRKILPHSFQRKYNDVKKISKQPEYQTLVDQRSNSLGWNTFPSLAGQRIRCKSTAVVKAYRNVLPWFTRYFVTSGFFLFNCTSAFHGRHFHMMWECFWMEEKHLSFLLFCFSVSAQFLELEVENFYFRITWWIYWCEIYFISDCCLVSYFELLIFHWLSCKN